MSYRSRLAAILVAIFGVAVLGAGCGSSGDGGETVAVSPIPGAGYASPKTQISFVGDKADGLAEGSDAQEKITVTGSKSGVHQGRFEDYEAVDGASFIPDQPFRTNEKVTVATDFDIPGSEDGKYSFKVADFRTDALPPPRVLPPESTVPVRHDSFKSRPDLKPPRVNWQRKPDGKQAPGDYFLAPKTDGPMIVDNDGDLLYLKPNLETADFRVQSYKGEPVLTWWQGPFNGGGYTQGTNVITGSDYKEIKRVLAGNGYNADLHEFRLNGEDTAYLTAYKAVSMDLTKDGGPKEGAVLDSITQEIDLDTGLVIWEWHSLDHVGLNETHIALPTSPKESFDYFHINSVFEDPDGNVLISGRNTFSVLNVDKDSQNTIWRLGGKKSDFEMGKGTNFSWQHDAIRDDNGNITLFDNAANYFGEPTYDHSRGLTMKVGEPGSKVELAQPALVQPERLSAPSQGNFQTLPDGNQVVGWGSQPYFTEYAPDGDVVAGAVFTSRNSSYRVYKNEWQGEPAGSPAIATERSDGELKAWASWNGDTRTAKWRLLAGSDENSLAEVASTSRDGFETELAGERSGPFVAVEALADNGDPIGRSATVQVGQTDSGADQGS